MCAEYFANDVGWSNRSFPNLRTEDKEQTIYNILQQFGSTFYVDSQEEAPQAISYFLFNYLNISNRNMAVLFGTPFSSEEVGSLRLIIEHIKIKKRPLISVVNENDEKTHAVVVRGVQESNSTGEITQVYYNDPWYGKKNKSKNEWNRYSLLNNNYLTMYFEDYN